MHYMGKEERKQRWGYSSRMAALYSCIQKVRMSSLWQATGGRDLAIKYSLKLNPVDTMRWSISNDFRSWNIAAIRFGL
jgi:hypothetical protein